MPTPTYERRGHRTLVALMVLRLTPAVLFLVALFVLTALHSVIATSFSNLFGDQALRVIHAYNVFLSIGFLLFILLALVLALAAWLEYISFSFFIDEHAFKTRSGILDISEMSILYHQIQNVDIDRPLMYRLFGMSRLSILTAGHEDPDHPELHDESEGIIDLIDEKKAEELQQLLLARSNVQEVAEVPLEATDLRRN
jgi:uncharacterized membrane protein YdbT with pleckstrin-like domain